MTQARVPYFVAAAFALVSASPAAAQLEERNALPVSSQLATVLSSQGAAPRPQQVRPSGNRLHRQISKAPLATRWAPTVSADRPDVFGTVALRVQRTSLDEKWRRVEEAAVGGPAATYAESLLRVGKRARLEAINRYVNGQVRFADDLRQYGQPDLWATANQTLNRGEGDCEDYAIAKLQMLRAAGFAATDMYLVILKDLVRRSDHAVAVVRLGNEMLVLDNGTDEVLESSAVPDYRPVFSFASNGSWTHGYKVDRGSVELAGARDAVEAALVPGTGRN